MPDHIIVIECLKEILMIFLGTKVVILVFLAGRY